MSFLLMGEGVLETRKGVKGCWQEGTPWNSPQQLVN